MGICRQRTFKKRRLPTKLRRKHSLRTALLTTAQRAKTAYTQKTAPKTALTKQKKCHEFCTTYAKIRDINNVKLNLPHAPKEGGETPFLPRERFRANAERALAKRGMHSDGADRQVTARGKQIPPWLHEASGTDDLADSTDRTCRMNGTTPSCRAGEGKSRNAVSGAWGSHSTTSTFSPCKNSGTGSSTLSNIGFASVTAAVFA